MPCRRHWIRQLRAERRSKRRDITGSSESDNTKVSRIFVGYEKGAFLALSGEK